jgi:hypothetical protein
MYMGTPLTSVESKLFVVKDIFLELSFIKQLSFDTMKTTVMCKVSRDGSENLTPSEMDATKTKCHKVLHTKDGSQEFEWSPVCCF